MFQHHRPNPGLPLQSSMSASWPVSGNGLRRGAGESVEFPTKVKEVVTLLVKPRRSISGAMDERFSSGMYLVPPTSKARI
jgi:hypothetical protein